MFDGQGFRYNVGIIILNAQNQVFWGRRCGQDAWQFPQGGMQGGESSEQAMFRELWEETGLYASDVAVLGETRAWLRYRLPLRFRRRRRAGMVQCIGQKQKWFLLKLKREETIINLAAAGTPEFDQWRWLNYWQAVEEVVHFKRKVYQLALQELSEFVPELTELRPISSMENEYRYQCYYGNKAPSFAKRRRD
nr:RNA pyrophosphohydrolase [Suttonella ornithocola]